MIGCEFSDNCSNGCACDYEHFQNCSRGSWWVFKIFIITSVGVVFLNTEIFITMAAKNMSCIEMHSVFFQNVFFSKKTFFFWKKTGWKKTRFFSKIHCFSYKFDALRICRQFKCLNTPNLTSYWMNRGFTCLISPQNYLKKNKAVFFQNIYSN